MTSGNLHDSKAAIPLLKKVEHLIPSHFTTAIFDAGYDYEPIYTQAIKQNMRIVIPYNPRREGEYIGFHSYCYDSFDEQYRTLKFTRPKECTNYPLHTDSLCQKVFKIKCNTDIRKYTYPARGSELWKNLYKNEHPSSE